MKNGRAVTILAAVLWATAAAAADRPPQGEARGETRQRERGQVSQAGPQQNGPDSAGAHEPPPQAYEDCKGKVAGDKVQHTTPEGIVAATCVDSPNGLVARPDQSPAGRRPLSAVTAE